MDKKQVIYPICGYRWGWCNSKEGCILVSPPFDFNDCIHFLRKHPLSGETYRQVRNGIR